MTGVEQDGTYNPERAINIATPNPFRAAVLPPVFGPVIAITFVFLLI